MRLLVPTTPTASLSAPVPPRLTRTSTPSRPMPMPSVPTLTPSFRTRTTRRLCASDSPRLPRPTTSGPRRPSVLSLAPASPTLLLDAKLSLPSSTLVMLMPRRATTRRRPSWTPSGPRSKLLESLTTATLYSPTRTLQPFTSPSRTRLPSAVRSTQPSWRARPPWRRSARSLLALPTSSSLTLRPARVSSTPPSRVTESLPTSRLP
mmetsp:Transcript_82534/g.114626  ORF Transcript_82534/g.114626 Transcript_82534/m.114626 type:complete len:206 (+) Transcript_82534:289-906(+)